MARKKTSNTAEASDKPKAKPSVVEIPGPGFESLVPPRPTSIIPEIVYGWLIESIGTPSLMYFAMPGGATCWVTNANEAMRFAREQDGIDAMMSLAEQRRKHANPFPPGMSVVEHGFMVGGDES